jgi:hypothetical protein
MEFRTTTWPMQCAPTPKPTHPVLAVRVVCSGDVHVLFVCKAYQYGDYNICSDCNATRTVTLELRD